MSNLDSILKGRDITLPTKVRLVKAMVFPVVMYGCESWTVKKAEHRRIDSLLEKTLESPLDCKEIQPVHSEGISPGISLEGMMLKLKLQYFGHLMRTTAHQAPPSLGFSRQEHWSGLPFPSPMHESEK